MKTKDELPACPVATAVSLIGGKWKLLILRNLKTRPWRFNELQRDLDGISQKVLTDSLRQMIDDGLAYLCVCGNLFDDGFVVGAEGCEGIDDGQHLPAQICQPIFDPWGHLLIVVPVGKAVVDHLA